MRKLTLKSGKEYHLDDLPGSDKLIYDSNGFPSTSNFTLRSEGAKVRHKDHTMRLAIKRNRLFWQDSDDVEADIENPDDEESWVDQVGGYIDQYTGMENGMPPIGVPGSSAMYGSPYSTMGSMGGYGMGGYGMGGYGMGMGGYGMGMGITPGSGVAPMIMPTTQALGGLQKPMSQTTFLKRTMTMYMQYLRGLNLKGMNWKTLNIRELQDLINTDSTLKSATMLLTSMLNRFRDDLDKNVVAKTIEIYDAINKNGYGEKYNNVLATQKESIKNFLKVTQPFESMCSSLTMSTGMVTTETQMMYGNMLCTTYKKVQKLYEQIGFASIQNDFRYVLDEIEKISKNQQMIEQNQAQLTQLLSDASGIYVLIGENPTFDRDLKKQYNRLIAKFPVDSLSTIDVAVATGSTPASLGSLTKTPTPPRQPITQAQLTDALQNIQAQQQQQDQTMANPVDPFTAQQNQSMVQVGAGYGGSNPSPKLPIGSFYMDDESVNDESPLSVLIPRHSASRTPVSSANTDDDLISRYINIAKNAIKDGLDSLYQKSEGVEEVIIERK